MNLTRQEDISLYLYIKDVVLGPHYAETETGQSLTQVSTGLWDIGYGDNTDTTHYPFKRSDSSGRGRGLLYFDYVGETSIFGSEQTGIVNIYNGAVTASGYRVNYLAGQIESNDDLSSYSVDYEWNYVSVLDAWPRDNVPFLPVVSIELQRGQPLPLQLGGGDIREGYWNLQIFGKNKGERDDLMDIIFAGLDSRRCPMYTFPSGLPLIGGGFYNGLFSTTVHTEYTSLFFENVKKKLSGLPQWAFYEKEQINRYRAEITFETKTYRW